jgi:HD-GYP domain-containing protein (c-di-GMP phosphodiesterase class II)
MSGLLGRLDLPVGKPLPHDLVDNLGRVLLSKGNVIDSAEKVEELLERGVSYSEGFSAQGGGGSGGSPRQSGPSKRFVEANPFERISDVIDELERIIHDQGPIKGFEAQIKTLASIISNSCDTDTDAALASLVLSQRNSYAVKHQVDVAILAAVVGQKMAIPQADRISIVCAALTMNLSMLEYQDWLQVKSGKLSEDELHVIRKHTLEGVTMLAQAGVRDLVWLQAVASHHESPDGSGYPRGLTGEENMNTGGQILRISDMYTARLSARAFNMTETANATLADIISMGRKQHMVQNISEQFIKALGFYPPGSFVRLSCGEIGIVVRRGKALNQPVVYSLVTSSGGNLGSPVRRETSMERFAVVGLVPRGEVNVKIDGPSLWGFIKT